MKMFGVIALLVALAFGAASAVAGNVEFGSDGSVRLVQEYTKSDITVTREALSHGDVWRQAIKNPNSIISVDQKFESKMVSLLYQEITRTIKVGVKFTEVNKSVDEVTGVVLLPYKMFNPYFISWLISVLAMMALNKMVQGGRFSGNRAFTAFAIALIATGVTMTFAADAIGLGIALVYAEFLAPIMVFAIIAVVAVFFAFICSIGKNRGWVVASGVFYVCMFASAGFMYGIL